MMEDSELTFRSFTEDELIDIETEKLMYALEINEFIKVFKSVRRIKNTLETNISKCQDITEERRLGYILSASESLLNGMTILYKRIIVWTKWGWAHTQTCEGNKVLLLHTNEER